MGRYIGPKCRLCRREGRKLFLKGQRCFTNKCAFERRPYIPGASRERAQKLSDYAVQLREKQRIKRIYGVQEGQFRRYFEMIKKLRGEKRGSILCVLERRLDNVVYRVGWAPSRTSARQRVVHRHILVNGKKVNIPSYLVKEGDEIRLIKKIGLEQDKTPPPWLSIDKEECKVSVLSFPEKEYIDIECDEELIAAFYSR